MSTPRALSVKPTLSDRRIPNTPYSPMARAKSFHRWAGLILGPLLILFSVSGIILNHKNVFDKIPIPRNLLPQQYHYSNWNNQLVAGAISLAPDSILLFSKNGALLSDSLARNVARFEKGLPNRLNRINDAIKLPNGCVIAALPDGVFALRSGSWLPLCHTAEPLASLTLLGDTLFAISRAALYIAPPPYDNPQRLELPPSPQHDRRIPLFRIIWDLHSGALFGLPGRLFVDLLGLALLALSVTGIAFSFNRKMAKTRAHQQHKARLWRARLRTAFKYHTLLGRLILLLLLLVITGTFLRPPLLIAIAYAKVYAPRGTSLYSPNPWHNKLRKIAYDPKANDFILSTTNGFYHFKDATNLSPQKINPAPPISVMGCNVLHQVNGEWLVGSFSGLYRWQRDSGTISDALSGAPYVSKGGMPIFGGLAAAGYAHDFPGGPTVFDYNKGAIPLARNAATPPMPLWLQHEPISLWNVALELHTGRFFSSLLDPITPFFIFFSGSLTTALLIAGWKRTRKPRKKRKTSQARQEMKP